MRKVLIILPVVILAALFALFALASLRGQKQPAQSHLLGQSAPAFSLKPLNGDTPVSLAAWRGKTVLVNFFASWCTPCRAEHPFLMQLKNDGVLIIGIDYKDKPAAARRMLDELGNPFAAIGQDRDGRTGIDFGITGVPESFVIGADGKVLANWPGPLDKNVMAGKILPALQRSAAAAD